jgi:hypothetical protein
MTLRVLIAAGLALFMAVANAHPAAGQNDAELARARRKMVDEAIIAAGVKNERVIQAMLETPRHEFVSSTLRAKAYFDMALPIGEQQTISSPFIVAYMTESLDPQPDRPVLEIGTGSGYQAAVLSPLVRRSTRSRSSNRSAAGGAHAPAARLQERPRQSRRRLSGLARARAVRQDHRHLLAGEGPASAGRAVAPKAG